MFSFYTPDMYIEQSFLPFFPTILGVTIRQHRLCHVSREGLEQKGEAETGWFGTKQEMTVTWTEQVSDITVLSNSLQKGRPICQMCPSLALIGPPLCSQTSSFSFVHSSCFRSFVLPHPISLSSTLPPRSALSINLSSAPSLCFSSSAGVVLGNNGNLFSLANPALLL